MSIRLPGLEQQEVHMSEEDLEVLLTLDDPGEDTLEEDTFHQADDIAAHGFSQPAGDAAAKN
jgi:hypothetical protein